MNAVLQQLIEEWRKESDQFINRLVEITQATAARTLMEQMLANMGTKPVEFDQVAAVRSELVETWQKRAEDRKKELLARSTRTVPKLSGDVTIKNPTPKTEAAIINQEDKNYGLLGSGCVTEALEVPMSIPIDGDSDE